MSGDGSTAAMTWGGLFGPAIVRVCRRSEEGDECVVSRASCGQSVSNQISYIGTLSGTSLTLQHCPAIPFHHPLLENTKTVHAAMDQPWTSLSNESRHRPFAPAKTTVNAGPPQAASALADLKVSFLNPCRFHSKVRLGRDRYRRVVTAIPINHYL
ncbi:hypothetical protein E2562_035028 [Oryza meyeriana var. granulata]|uniref:Uncharacterized protein n=1 Tax=Oryza meyeriana var. granulata TaxID=110450 RepID=A0A6G1FFD6_9ORYZ|nr:hypothetical protein E2562_035028 [Oryza meyeriana var. granulata]